MNTKQLALSVRTIDSASRSITAIASTDAVDAYGEIVDQGTWDLKRYESNPVVLFAHDSRELPIGRCTSVGVEGGQLKCRIQFLTPDANPKAEQVWQAVRQGALRAISVGFIPREVREEKRDGRAVTVLSDNELLEISVVPIPANPEALMRARTAPNVPASIANIAANAGDELAAMLEPDVREIATELGLDTGAAPSTPKAQPTRKASSDASEQLAKMLDGEGA